MRICVFSDIHGNGPAFWAAYDMMLKEKADVYLCLGDLCGYYFDQIEIFKALTRIPNLVCVKGNHDDVFLRILKGDSDLAHMYKEAYGCSMEYLVRHETPDFVQWLSALPYSVSFSEQKSFVCYGSPWNLLEGYVYPDTRLDEFVHHPADLFFLGHTHYPMHRNIDNKKIVNPGSLGQPRDGGRPTYAVLELPSDRVFFREVIYDKNALRKKIDDVGEKNAYLRDVLKRHQD